VNLADWVLTATFLAGVLISISLIVQGALPVSQEAAMKGVKHRRSSVLAYISTSSIAFVVLAILVLGTGSFSGPKEWSGIFFVKLAGMTVLYAIANVCIFESMRHIPPAAFGLIFTFRVAVIVFWAYLSLGEDFVWQNGVGVVMIIAFVALATSKRPPKVQVGQAVESDETVIEAVKEDPRRYGFGLGMAFVGTVCFGSANVIDSSVIQTFDPKSYLLFRLLLPLLLVVVFTMIILPRVTVVLPGVKKFIDLEVTRADLVSFMNVIRPLRQEEIVPVSSLTFKRFNDSKLTRIRIFIRRYMRWLLLLAVSTCVVVSSGTFMWAYAVSRQLGVLSSVHQLSLFFTIGFDAIGNKAVRDRLGWFILAAFGTLGGVAMMLFF
jgi:drug/metabolite transporter (DMT)-like permease